MKKFAAYIIAALGFGIYGVVTDVDRDDSGAIVGATGSRSRRRS